jgi:hypothetical protein
MPVGRQRCSSNTFPASALEGVVAQPRAPASLPQGKTRYSLYIRLGRPRRLSGRARKMFSPLGFDPQIVQLVANRYSGLPICE